MCWQLEATKPATKASTSRSCPNSSAGATDGTAAPDGPSSLATDGRRPGGPAAPGLLQPHSQTRLGLGSESKKRDEYQHGYGLMQSADFHQDRTVGDTVSKVLTKARNRMK